LRYLKKKRKPIPEKNPRYIDIFSRLYFAKIVLYHQKTNNDPAAMHEVSSCFSKTFVITVVYVLKVHERKMRNISHEMKSCMGSKNKLGFARKNIASPLSRSPFYSLRKRKKSANSIELLMCSHPSYFGISHTRFRAKNFAVVESGLNRTLQRTPT
jgi:hypothetical protein